MNRIELCRVPCPKCGSKCWKESGHGERDGIASLCWCRTCDGWYLPGEPTLISERSLQHRGTTITDLEKIVDNALGENAQ